MRRRIIAIAFATLSIGGAAEGQEFKSGGITVVTPWARATPGGAKVGGAYLELKAAAGIEDRLVAAKSAAAGTVEIHDHINEGGIMKMRRVDGIKLSGGQTVTLKPGGYHLMLMDLKQPLKQGGKLPLTLVFEKAGEVAVEALIAPIGAAGPSGEAAPRAGHGTPSKASGGHKH
ncbi:MAG: copper chaperone PCu(A)C [Hyphomicrobiaceae bacterium]|jgi:copper(I)-binding protein